MKKLLLLLLLSSTYICSAEAQLFRQTEPVDIVSQRTDSQIRVGQQRPMEKDIEYKLEHYTDGELRNYAKMLNNQAIAEAKANGEPLPEKLSQETLKSRQKIAEYLREYFGITID